MENKTALEELLGVISSKRQRANENTPHEAMWFTVEQLLIKQVEKDKEQRKALVIESFKDCILIFIEQEHGRVTFFDELETQEQAEQYYKQKHESNEST